MRITDNIFIKWDGLSSNWTIGIHAAQEMIAQLSLEDYEEGNFSPEDFILTNKIIVGFLIFSIIFYYE